MALKSRCSLINLERRLKRQIVSQNGGKFESFTKLIKTSCLVQFEFVFAGFLRVMF